MRSARLASTRTPRRGFSRNEYHSSVLRHSAGSIRVDGCSRSSTRTTASCTGGWVAKRAPTSFPYQGQPYSVSVAAWMPAKPPPERTNRSKAASCAASSTSPVVERNTTARYLRRFASVNAPGSSVASVSQRPAPTSRTAAIPSGIDA